MASKERKARKENFESIKEDVAAMNTTKDEIMEYMEALKTNIAKLKDTTSPHMEKINHDMSRLQTKMNSMKDNIEILSSIVGKDKEK